MLSNEYRYKILKRLEASPEMSQRALARELGISLGKVNYCLQALAEKGLVKFNRCRENPNKGAYVYVLTPKGIREKARVTLLFLKAKVKEHEMLCQEIEELRREAKGYDPEVHGEAG